MMGVIGSEANGEWVTEQLVCYLDRHFLVDGKPDLTTNVRYVTDFMIGRGFCPNGKEQDYKDLHIFSVDYFCPRQTTGEYIKTNNTYCEHIGINSWTRPKHKIRLIILSMFSPALRSKIIKTKRKLLG